MKRNSNILIAAVLLCLGAPAMAQDQIVLTLEECRQLALQQNTGVRAAILDETAAQAKKDEIFTNYFPQVNIIGFAFHSMDYMMQMNVNDIFGGSELAGNMQALWDEMWPELGADSRSFNYLHYGQHYGITALQPIYMGGRIVNGNRYASLGIEAANLKRSMAERDVEVEVEQNYFNVTALQEKQKTLEALQSLLDSLGGVSDVALGEGVILKADKMLLETKKMELRSGMAKLKAGLRLYKMNLLNSIGVEYSILDLDKYVFPGSTIDEVPSPEEVYVDENQVVASMEERRLLDLQVEAARYEKKLTLGSTLPQIGLGFSYGYNRFMNTNPGNWNGTAFVIAQIPISDWAKNSYKMKQQQVAVEKALDERDHLSEMLILQQRKFYLELTSAWDALELARSQAEYSEYLYNQAKVNFDAGYITVAELLQVYSTLAEAQEAQMDALSDYLTALQVYKGHIND